MGLRPRVTADRALFRPNIIEPDLYDSGQESLAVTGRTRTVPTDRKHPRHRHIGLSLRPEGRCRTPKPCRIESVLEAIRRVAACQ